MIGAIAVGFGGAGGSEALARPTQHAERTGARLSIVHLCMPGSPLAGTTHADIESVDPPPARAYAKTQTRLRGRGVALEHQPPVAAAHTSAADEDDYAAGTRLLVVGDKRRGVIGHARTGDLPLTAATEAACRVAVVQGEHDEGDLL